MLELKLNHVSKRGHRSHVKPLIDYYALEGGAVFIQEGATPQTIRISQEVLYSAAIDVLLWPAKSPDIVFIKTVWSVILICVNGMNQFPTNSTELHAACEVNDRTSQRRTQYDQWAALHGNFALSSTFDGGHWLYLNNWMDLLSSHYLRVKFILRLMHSINALIHVIKASTERSILGNKCIYNYSTKNTNDFSLNTLGQWLLRIIK